jgi:hypothetical protein
MSTSLYPKYKKRIDDSFDLLIKNQVTPWAFLNSGKPFKVKTFEQRSISYEGVGFEGSPAQVFWSGYIEPFIEDIATRLIAEAAKEASDRNADATLLLPEIEGLFQAGVRRVFVKMSNIDWRLRGKGFPENVSPRPVENELSKVMEFISTHIRAELQMWKPRPKFEVWYERNKSLAWVIGIIVAVVGLYAKFK